MCAYRARLALATVLASVLWGGFVARSGWLWAPAPQHPVRERPVEMTLVELAAPPVAAPHPHPQASQHTTPTPPRAVAKPRRPRVREARPPAVVPSRPSESITTPAPPQTSRPAPAPQPENDTTQHATPTAEATPSLPGNAPARLLSQPLPDLPDDLREAAYRAIAVARFTVHTDGSVDVELIRPTPIPRLNQILLDALRRWRFAPATENGRPVESHQDVRVHFNVS